MKPYTFFSLSSHHNKIQYNNKEEVIVLGDDVMIYDENVNATL